MLSIGHILSCAIALKVTKQILTGSPDLVTWIIVSWAWKVLFMPKIIDKSLLTRAPSSCSCVFDCGEPIDSVLVDLDAIAVSAGAWDILFEINVQRFFRENFNMCKKLTFAILGSPLKSELSALCADGIDAASVGSRAWLLWVHVSLL